MPIVTRTLESVQQSAGGTVLASFLAVDDQGREWRRSRARFASESAAVVTSNAFDWASQLEDADFQELLVWVQAKNLPGDFDFTDRDLTLLSGEERLLIWFAEHFGDEAITVAWWIENLGPPQFNAIRNRVGYDSATGSRIQDRAIDLAVAEPTFDAVEETPV